MDAVCRNVEVHMCVAVLGLCSYVTPGPDGGQMGGPDVTRSVMGPVVGLVGCPLCMTDRYDMAAQAGIVQWCRIQA